MDFQISTRHFRICSQALSRVEQHLRKVFRFCDSNVSGIDVQLSASRGSYREFTCRLLVRLNCSEDVVIIDRGGQLGALIKRAGRRGSHAVRKRLGRRRTLKRRTSRALATA